MARKPDGPLRRGWTTGACATAATAAAFEALLTGHFPDPIEIALPKGERPSFALAHQKRAGEVVTAGIVKDAGDDPDVTHGALILSSVRALGPNTGLRFKAGRGVGTVTKPGLPIPPGEPAINPVPRRMMTEVVQAIAARFGGRPDLEITISIPQGEEMARHTWNPRLGILGGLSILGTTGIVHPFSCSAWIASIHRGIDVARASHLDHVAGCTGSTSEDGVKKLYDLPDFAFIDMGDFVGGMLKYLRDHPIPRLTIGGGFAKLAKLATGAMDLHSGRSQLDRAAVAGWLAELGADPALIEKTRIANTGAEILEEAQARGLALGELVAKRARDQASAVVEGKVAIEVVAFDRAGAIVGRAGFA
ncbi:cobalt-precorrin-5B C(1)-methyltransferase [Hypericibacter terrae]|uniref:Cobalt-precorrin-5B C(1)-methyltransferase n=1 Tax=Hypericibacter terrae TaxID=2602015 RepID=A0A5J6MNA1_9PROT|nr:cobalt-precorrin-5B (C(1))-methyltransferase [Hypericibacter terrae]QEX18657.1 cobalt-precorrin-5B C(1)-methyltransferase [Hypericibacter terrae]